jgi:hypothetical protein
MDDGKKKLPIKAIQIEATKIDSLSKLGFKEFQWK